MHISYTSFAPLNSNSRSATVYNHGACKASLGGFVISVNVVKGQDCLVAVLDCGMSFLHGWQFLQHPMMYPTPTMSPALNLLTSDPTSTTLPTSIRRWI